MKEYKKFAELIYERPDFEKLQKQLIALAERAKNAADYRELRAVIDESNALNDQAIMQSELAMIRCYLDSSDTFYGKEMQFCMQQSALLDDTALADALLNSPFAAQLDAEFGPLYLQRQRDHIRLTANGRELLAKEQELAAKYQQLKATIRISFNGCERSEGEMTPYLTGTDRDTRRSAALAVQTAFVAKKQEFEELLSQLVETRCAIAKANGFDRYVDYANLEKGRRGYGQAELLAFCRQVKQELVPLCAELARKQAKRMGLDRICSYDASILFPDGNAKPVGDGPVLLKAAKGMYDELDSEIAGLYRTMADGGYIDVSASPNKISGMGFCTDLRPLKMPYVFGNCDGSIHDASVLTHEVGHAYQMWLCMNGQPVPEYCNMPNDVAEIPSKAMEQFTGPFAELFFGKGAAKFRFAHLQGVVEEICAFCAIHEYEDWLYANPSASPAERAERYCTIMTDYSPETDFSEIAPLAMQGSMLFRSMGVYMFPCYLISYALSDMCALEFRERYEQNSTTAWQDYRRLCAAGGSLDYDGLLQLAHLRTAYAPGTAARAAKYTADVLDRCEAELNHTAE